MIKMSMSNDKCANYNKQRIQNNNLHYKPVKTIIFDFD